MIKKTFKNISLFIVALFVLVSVSACSTKTEKTESGTKVTQDKIITDDVSYTEDNSEVTIKRNKVTKKASIEMIYNIAEEDEYDDFFGERVTMIPMLFNMSCSMLTMSIFDPEALDELVEEGEFEKNKNPKDDKMEGYLDGYTTEKISIKFVDAKTGEEIAYCESKEAGNENIEVRISRDYSDVQSLFGVEIGKFSDN